MSDGTADAEPAAQTGTPDTLAVLAGKRQSVPVVDPRELRAQIDEIVDRGLW
ncbi:hypothetical protein ACFRFH_12780 [Leifsonia sp. NPDC056824]|uniref:hypothetical protein n=1 Tax=Leifsonia sp. NPDC056824 TaxID=3345953 RepID=UPI0036C13677